MTLIISNLFAFKYCKTNVNVLKYMYKRASNNLLSYLKATPLCSAYNVFFLAVFINLIYLFVWIMAQFRSENLYIFIFLSYVVI